MVMAAMKVNKLTAVEMERMKRRNMKAGCQQSENFSSFEAEGPSVDRQPSKPLSMTHPRKEAMRSRA